MSKLGFFLGALLVLIPIGGFSQSSNWNSIIDLNVTVSSGDRIDLYTDRDGNHVIVHKSNQLVYYLFNAAGSQVRTSVEIILLKTPGSARLSAMQEICISFTKKAVSSKPKNPLTAGLPGQPPVWMT